MAQAALLPGSDPEVSARLDQEMDRLRPFLKKISPLLPASAPPTTADGSVALSDMRFFHFPFHARFQGKEAKAVFLVSLVNGPKVDVAFLSGSEDLTDATDSLSTFKYPQSFPDSKPVRVIRKVTLSCNVYSKDCSLILLPAQEAAVSPGPLLFSVAPQ